MEWDERDDDKYPPEHCPRLERGKEEVSGKRLGGRVLTSRITGN
jgi:hypothetical protein